MEDERNGDIVETLTYNSQVHERYIYATGGNWHYTNDFGVWWHGDGKEETQN